MAPPNIVIAHVETPSEHLIDELVSIFFDLEKDNPAWDAVTAGDSSRIPSLASALMTPLISGVGDVYTARDEDGILVGFALWTAPGKCLFSTEDQMNMGYIDYLQGLPEECAIYHSEVMGKDVPAFIDEAIGITEAGTKTYWCEFMYVLAEYQGKGISTAFVKLAYEKARKSNAIMALTTQESRNVPIYERLGFKVVGHRVVKSPWVDWPLWVFSRETQT